MLERERLLHQSQIQEHKRITSQLTASTNKNSSLRVSSGSRGPAVSSLSGNKIINSSASAN